MFWDPNLGLFTFLKPLFIGGLLIGKSTEEPEDAKVKRNEAVGLLSFKEQKCMGYTTLSLFYRWMRDLPEAGELDIPICYGEKVLWPWFF